MSRTRICAAVALAALAFASPAWADAAGDLMAGRAALGSGDAARALPLLESAARDLPQSVEAQFALAQACLQTGQFDKARDQLDKVLKLSPDHAQARTLLDAITGQRETFEQKLAYGRALMSAGLHSHAMLEARQLMAGPATDEQRLAARLLLAEAKVLSGFTDVQLVEALKAVSEAKGTSSEGPARVLAAMALVASDNPAVRADADAMLKAADATVPRQGVWRDRLTLISLVRQLDDPANAPAVAKGLAGVIGSIPPSPYSEELLGRLIGRLTECAVGAADRNDLDTAMRIVAPAYTAVEIPAGVKDQAAMVGKAIDVKGGWMAAVPPMHVGPHLAEPAVALAEREQKLRGRDATFLSLWLADSWLRPRTAGAAPVEPVIDARLHLLDRTGDLARLPVQDGKADLLSAAQPLAQQMIESLIDAPTNLRQRNVLANLIMSHVGRACSGPFERDGHKALGLFNISLDDPKSIFSRLPQGPAHADLLFYFANQYRALGEEAFNKAAESPRGDVNNTLNQYDRAALQLLARGLKLYPPLTHTAKIEGEVKSPIYLDDVDDDDDFVFNADDAPEPAPKPVRTYANYNWASAGADVTISRYQDAKKWAAAEAGYKLLYAEVAGGDLAERLIGLKIVQANAEMTERLQAQRRVDKLPAPMTDAIRQAVALIKAEPVRTDWVKYVFNEQLSDLLRMDRADLAMEVVEGLAGPAGADKLAEWALLTRAKMAGMAAQRMLAISAATAEPGQGVKLEPSHALELKLLGELADKFPDSPHGGVVAARVGEIANLYRSHRSFATADAVLADFVQAHPKVRGAERLAFARIQVAMARADDALVNRPADAGVPQKISDEYAAALDVIAGFLKDHPTGSPAYDAEGEMLNIARIYGSAGAWPVARTVIERFVVAVPDFREPARARLWLAATWLGELESAHGLAMLTPPPPPQLPGPVERSLGEGDEDGMRNSGGGLFGGDDDDTEEYSRQERVGGSGGEGPGALGLDAYGDVDTPPAAARGGAVEIFDARDLQHPITDFRPPVANRPADIHEVPGESLAAIRQGEQQRLQQIARMEQQGGQQAPQVQAKQPGGIVLPTGVLLSEEAMKKQDAASDAAYAILLDLHKNNRLEPVGAQARGEILWMFGYFEGQLRPDRAVVLIERLLADRPDDADRVALAYRVLSDRVVWAAGRQPNERIDQAWVDARHERFETARTAIDAFLQKNADRRPWDHRAMMLRIRSYEQEASLAAVVSPPRAAGLLARAADEVLKLASDVPDHPDRDALPGRLWSIADQLVRLGQRDQALYVLSRIAVRFPTSNLANQSVLRMAQLYAEALTAPLRAVETYQEYLALGGDDNAVRSQVYQIAQQLAGRQRYVEALHVYGVFVDSFPTDPRAAQALGAIGQIHQTNEAFGDAIAAYQRILEEYKSSADWTYRFRIAECHIHLSQWRDARRIYSDYLESRAVDVTGNNAQVDPQQGGNRAMAATRIEVLKSLERYQTLLADKQVTRNKDSAQFEIGRIVLERLSNRVKAVEEFAKVIKGWPQSHLADDAQYEIGTALLDLGRLDEAREALLRVARDYPNSPQADDALYKIGQSYEQQAQRLASVTLEQARQIAFEEGQKGAYQEAQKRIQTQTENIKGQVQKLRQAGKGKEAELTEAYSGFRYQGNEAELSNIARKAEQAAETESALEVANRQDRINEAYRNAVAVYKRAADEHPLGDATDESLLRMASIFETELKDRKAAMETYQRVVKFFPGTPVAEDAAWKVASFYEAEGDYDQAAQAYRDFIRTYPASKRVADAQFALAEALEQLGRWVEAMDAYQTFRDKFAQHPKAPTAQDQIQWIRAYRMK